MSAVATLLAEMGHRVSGHDPADDTPFLGPLRALGVEIRTGVATGAVDGVDAVITSTATPRDHPDVVAAAGIIEARGFTTIDDIVHGYGGGYLSPILSSKSRVDGAHPVPEEPFETDMMLVIQPNVVTPDQRAGVQTGEMVRVTATGIERMHGLARGFGRIG